MGSRKFPVEGVFLLLLRLSRGLGDSLSIFYADGDTELGSLNGDKGQQIYRNDGENPWSCSTKNKNVACEDHGRSIRDLEYHRGNFPSSPAPAAYNGIKEIRRKRRISRKPLHGITWWPIMRVDARETIQGESSAYHLSEMLLSRHSAGSIRSISS